jgi:hypothetical protein
VRKTGKKGEEENVTTEGPAHGHHHFQLNLGHPFGTTVDGGLDLQITECRQEVFTIQISDFEWSGLFDITLWY